MSDEQTSGQPATTKVATQEQTPSDAWGQPISADRQVELQGYLDRWHAETDHGYRYGPFDSSGSWVTAKDIVILTGADVSWLAKQSISEFHYVANLHLEGASLSKAHLEGAYLGMAHLEGAYLNETHLEGASVYAAHLEGASVYAAHLEGADLRVAHLEDASLYAAHLEHAKLSEAYLESADLHEAHLEGANLSEAHLEGANLSEAHLEGANLSEAHLEGANLYAAHLEGANLSEAHLESKIYKYDDEDLKRITALPIIGHRLDTAVQRGVSSRLLDNFDQLGFAWNVPPADLREAFLDTATSLSETVICVTGSNDSATGPSFADVRWGAANLSRIDWTYFTEQGAHLGDERAAREWHPKPYEEKLELKEASRHDRALARQNHEGQQLNALRHEWAAAVRANRQLATALRDQGMNDEGDHFAYRAQVCQRRLLQVQGKWGRAAFSRFLDLLAGYGYKPVRTLIAYLVVIFGFALGYWLLGPISHHPFAPDGALVFSVTSFHGRGFFPGSPDLEDWITRLAALEAVTGLIIEICFIATFTQRYFGSK